MSFTTQRSPKPSRSKIISEPFNLNCEESALVARYCTEQNKNDRTPLNEQSVVPICEFKSIIRFIFSNYSLIDSAIIEKKFTRIVEVASLDFDQEKAQHRRDLCEDNEHKARYSDS